jgi:hypothetical protein
MAGKNHIEEAIEALARKGRERIDHAQEGFLGAVGDLAREGLGDIREKLVEEGWFGRTTAPADKPEKDVVTFAEHGAMSWDSMREKMAEAMGYQTKARARRRYPMKPASIAAALVVIGAIAHETKPSQTDFEKFIDSNVARVLDEKLQSGSIFSWITGKAMNAVRDGRYEKGIFSSKYVVTVAGVTYGECTGIFKAVILCDIKK